MRTMKRAVFVGSFFMILLLVICCLATADGAVPTISVGDGSISLLGSTTTVSITLDEAPAGLSGYTITVSLSDPDIAEITAVTFPGWASLNDNSELPADSFWMKAVDLNHEVESGATNVDLGTLTIRGDADGACEIDVTVDRADDDSGDPITPSVSSGTVAVGGTAAVFRVTSTGNVLADGAFYGVWFFSGSADVAEWVPISEPVEPGDVLEFDPENPGHYRRSRGSCSNLVAGVVSTEPGFVLGAELVTDDCGLGTEDRALLALVGIVPVKVTDEGGPIELGDLLVCSSIPGYAMKWSAGNGKGCGLIGKALELLEGGTGVIKVLLMR